MNLQPFELERWQSTWENRVAYNLAESGIHPVSVREVMGDEALGMLDKPLGYSQTNGTEELRKSIAALYPKATADNLIVTNGSSEAIFVTLWAFLQRGVEVALMLPNYMQTWGLSKIMQAGIKKFWLKENAGKWTLDIDEVKKSTSKRTRLISICNPNNPTGAVVDDEMIDAVCEIAKKIGAWIISDEVYQGAELDGRETPTFWGRYGKVIVTNGLSKAYGLPGLRLGWAVAPADVVERLWSFHDYTTIGPSALSDQIARKVMQPETRTRLLTRTRNILRTNLSVVSSWVDANHRYLSFIPPKAGAIAYLKLSLKISSTELAEQVLRKESTLIVPGGHFGMDHYLRIGYGVPLEHLEAGLERVGKVLAAVEGGERD